MKMTLFYTQTHTHTHTLLDRALVESFNLRSRHSLGSDVELAKERQRVVRGKPLLGSAPPSWRLQHCSQILLSAMLVKPPR